MQHAPVANHPLTYCTGMRCYEKPLQTVTEQETSKCTHAVTHVRYCFPQAMYRKQTTETVLHYCLRRGQLSLLCKSRHCKTEAKMSLPWSDCRFIWPNITLRRPIPLSSITCLLSKPPLGGGEHGVLPPPFSRPLCMAHRHHPLHSSRSRTRTPSLHSPTLQITRDWKHSCAVIRVQNMRTHECSKCAAYIETYWFKALQQGHPAYACSDLL